MKNRDHSKRHQLNQVANSLCLPQTGGGIRPLPATTNPTTGIRHPASDIQYRASSIQQFLAVAAAIMLTCIWSAGGLAANPDATADTFLADIRKLSAIGDRSTGSNGNAAAAAYIKDRFSALGIETVGSHQFDVATIKPKSEHLNHTGAGPDASHPTDSWKCRYPPDHPVSRVQGPPDLCRQW